MCQDLKRTRKEIVFASFFLILFLISALSLPSPSSLLKSVLWINLPFIASEKRGSSYRNEKRQLAKTILHCKTVVYVLVSFVLNTLGLNLNETFEACLPKRLARNTVFRLSLSAF